MDFEQIVLSRTELKALRKSKSSEISCVGIDRLVRLHLVDLQYSLNSGRMATPTGFARITDLGIDYLAYINRRFAEYRKTRILSIIAIIISLLSLLIQAASWLWKGLQ